MAGEGVTGRERDAGLAAVVGATLVFSWGFPITKAAGLPPAVFAFWRLLLGAVVLLVALVARGGHPVRHAGPPRLVVAAGMLFGLHQMMAVGAVLHTSIAIVTLVAALQPLVVALVGHRFVGERVPPALVGWAAVGVLAVAVVVQANLGDGSQSVLGDVLAVLNLLGFTAYFLVAKRAREAGASTLAFTAGALSVAWLTVVPVALLTTASPGFRGGRELALVALVALVPGQGHLLLNWAHTRVSAALSSLVLAGLPLLAGLWAHLLEHEPYGWRHVVGMALVVVAIEGGRRAERRGGGTLVLQPAVQEV